MPMKLYGYWRSTAAHRVRIALHLKGIPFESIPVDLVHGAQHQGELAALNPQHLVPTLVDGTTVISQSLAIVEYLEERFTQPPLLPADPAARARVRQIALAVATDLHPLNNLRVLRYLKTAFSADPAMQQAWRHHWLAIELTAIEPLLDAQGPYATGSAVSLADLCLVPQLFGARRFDFPLANFPRLLRVEAACARLPAFARARPEVQADAPAEAARGG